MIVSGSPRCRHGSNVAQRAGTVEVSNIEQYLPRRRPIVVPAMVESDQAEERLARVEHMLGQLKRQPASLKAITAKLVNFSVFAAPSLVVDTLPPVEPSQTPTLRAGVTRVALPSRVEQKNERRVSWRSRRTS